MLVVSWNMAANGPGKNREVHERAWGYLAALDPDLGFLQEAIPPPWAHERWTVVRPPEASWASAIIAKPALDLRALDGPPEANLKGGLTTAFGTVWVEGDDVVVVSVHAPVLKGGARDIDLAGRAHDETKLPCYKRASLRDVAYAICRDFVRGRRFIVSGDWNTSPILWAQLHPKDCEAEFFTRAVDDDWANCYDRLHPGEEGRTWFRGHDACYQLDHAFCDATTAEALTSCDIDPSPALFLRVSDHAPIVLTFRP